MCDSKFLKKVYSKRTKKKPISNLCLRLYIKSVEIAPIYYYPYSQQSTWTQHVDGLHAWLDKKVMLSL